LHQLVRKQKQRYQRKAASHKQIGKEKGTKRKLTKTQNANKGLATNLLLSFFCLTPSRKILLTVATE
jgi:hypothetical protein